MVVLSKNKLKELTFEQKEIPRFSADIQFDPYPQTVNIENQYDCNVSSLRVCNINDSTTLFGCKELIVRCHHFDEDTPYIENNETIIIPKNSTADEGYALAITTIADACNPYHGDMTLVTTDADSSEYMLICTCKNPGYIGNESLLGNCTSIFVCNGKIDNIDQPLNKINCQCDARQTTIRYEDGLPVCKDLLVHEANELYSDWSNIVPWNSFRQIETSAYNVTISGNLKTSRLLDPCQSSLHDTTIQIPDSQYNSAVSQCVVNESGFPVVNGLLKFTSSDDVKVGISAILATGNYYKLRFSDNIAGVRKIYGLGVNGLKFSKNYENTKVVLHPPSDINLAFKTGFSFDSKTKFVAPTCVGHWPSYSCSSLTEKDTYILGGLALPNARSCPKTFLWGRDDWDNHEQLLVRSVTIHYPRGYELSSMKLTNVDNLQTYGIQWVPQSSDELNGILAFSDVADYNIHKNVLTG